jgi:hypothetical protein
LLWRPLADQGNASAQALLGVIYEAGHEGVPQDYAEAVKWFRRAADQGVTGAQTLLGEMYAIGRGVPQDYVQAYRWASLGVSQASNPEEKGAAAAARDAIAAKMTAAQIAQAQAPTSPKAAKAEEQYRAVTPEDNLTCAARVASMELSGFEGLLASLTPSGGQRGLAGELKGFECADKEGKTKSIDLMSTKLVDGKIETKDFGTILMKSPTGSSATYSMSESQINKLKKFLGF